MGSKHLFVSAEIGLFEHIADAGSTLDDLSTRTKLPRRTLPMIADAMAALGFVERRGDLWPVADAVASQSEYVLTRSCFRWSSPFAWVGLSDRESAAGQRRTSNC